VRTLAALPAPDRKSHPVRLTAAIMLLTPPPSPAPQEAKTLRALPAPLQHGRLEPACPPRAPRAPASAHPRRSSASGVGPTPSLGSRDTIGGNPASRRWLPCSSP